MHTYEQTALSDSPQECALEKDTIYTIYYYYLCTHQTESLISVLQASQSNS